MEKKEAASRARAALRTYAQCQRNLDAWTREERELEARRNRFLSPSSPHYGPAAGGGGAGESRVEKAAMLRERITGRLEDIRLDMEEARLFLWRVDNALAALREDERKALTMHYIDGLAWCMVGDALFLSECSVRQKAMRAMLLFLRVFERDTTTPPAASVCAV